MLEQAKAVLFDGLPKDEILAAYAAGRGKEIESGKFVNPGSSSALVANAFGPFLARPRDLCLPEIKPVRTVALEREVRFPWRGGLHPWLDVVVETDSQYVGIESKRYEPFRDKRTIFSEAFQRDVWGSRMQPYQRLRDELSQGYLHFDPVQLTKHALALRTQAHKRHAQPVLIYLYAEPEVFPSGKPIHQSSIERHRHEVKRYTEAVAGAEVRFLPITYADLLLLWRQSSHAREHAERLDRHYSLKRNQAKETDPS